MFKDLKEYQDITRIYNESVNISEEQRAINKIFIEEGFTLEEIEYLEENFNDLWENELAQYTQECIDESFEGQNLTEEQVQQIDEVLGLKLAAKGITKLAPKISKGLRAANVGIKKGLKSASTAIGDTAKGAASVGKSALSKVGGAIKKAAPIIGKGALLATGAALPVAAVGGIVKGVNALRNRGKAEREANTNKNNTPSTAEIRANNPNAVGGGNAGGSTDSGEGKTYTSTPTQGTPPPESKTETKPTETKVKKMHPIEKKNRARFGDAHVDKLKAKQVDFKAMRKGTMSKDDFIKKYPKSITAQKAKGLRDQTEWDAYDMVLEYLFSTEQVASLEEANYVMMEMDQETIGSIVSEVKYSLDEGIIDNLKAGAKKVGSLVQKGVDRVKAAAGGVKDKVEKRVERRKENVAINTRIKEKQSGPDANSGKTKAQVMALNRKKEKLNNPKEYARKQAMSGREKAQALAKARIAAKEKANQPRGRVG